MYWDIGSIIFDRTGNNSGMNYLRENFLELFHNEKVPNIPVENSKADKNLFFLEPASECC